MQTEAHTANQPPSPEFVARFAELVRETFKAGVRFAPDRLEQQVGYTEADMHALWNLARTSMPTASATDYACLSCGFVGTDESERALVNEAIASTKSAELAREATRNAGSDAYAILRVELTRDLANGFTQADAATVEQDALAEAAIAVFERRFPGLTTAICTGECNDDDGDRCEGCRNAKYPGRAPITKHAICGIPDSDGCCVCLRPLGHTVNPHAENFSEREYCLGLGFLSLPLPPDVHPSFERDVRNRHRPTSRSTVPPAIPAAPKTPTKHAVTCGLGMNGSRPLSIIDSCACHWQIGFACPNCLETIVTFENHMQEGRSICVREVLPEFDGVSS